MSHALLNWVGSQPWMLHRAYAENALAVVTRHAAGVRLSPEDVAMVTNERDRRRARMTRERSQVSRMARRGPERGMSLDPSDEPLWYMADGGVAVVPVDGLLCKYARMVNGASQPRGMTPADIRYGIFDALAANPAHIVLDIDSPGGTVSGGHDMVELIAEAREAMRANGKGQKLIAYAHDLCCSGAYLLASQCDEVWCSEQATVGSIGVYVVVYDTSAAMAEAGVKANLIASGPHKGAGEDGVELSTEHHAHFQKSVDEMCDWFVSRVSEGRDMDRDQVEALATGDTWVGPRAVEAGLSDGVRGFRELLADLAE